MGGVTHLRVPRIRSVHDRFPGRRGATKSRTQNHNTAVTFTTHNKGLRQQL